MSPTRPEVVPLQAPDDVVRARHAVRRAAIDAGFGLVDQTRIVTAVSELARNTLVHGGGGRMELTAVVNGTRQGLRVAFADEGPGIADVGQALQDGWSTGTGLGLGLGGAQRLVHDFDVAARPGGGNTVTVVRWR